jgi:hypothetical protein
MPLGRCAGCGMTDMSQRKVIIHIRECDKYADLFRTAPEQALSPLEEQRRWSEEQGKELAKQAQGEARAGRAAAHKEVNDRKLQNTYDRWAAPTAHRSTSVPVTTPDDGLSWGSRVDDLDMSEEDVGKRVAALRFCKQW